jgi:hypothetical protein
MGPIKWVEYNPECNRCQCVICEHISNEKHGGRSVARKLCKLAHTFGRKFVAQVASAGVCGSSHFVASLS